MLNQVPRNSRHVNRLPRNICPYFFEEFDERKFLFGVQIIAHVSNLGGFLCRQWDCLA
jgi:hypothetical protein